MTTSPQQFCLRWNNHQSNIISVFEQLLHSEAFVDVTLAVEGMSLKAHKVVLSACSPYFQAVLASHPDKHPIVILKDVRYVDMRDLLDFMYRGEVSVDQDNLSGFLRVAESLRIKGLTEVNEKKRLESTTSAFLLSQSRQNDNAPAGGIINAAATLSTHREGSPLKRPPLSPTGSFSKRRRGRPPKISGEESEGEVGGHGNIPQRGGATDGEEPKVDLEMKDIKAEEEEFGAKGDGNQNGVEGDSRGPESAGPSGEIQGKDDRKQLKEEPLHTRESPGSEWTIPRTFRPLPVAVRIKRPRGRPRRVPRQQQDSSRWLPLLPKPSRGLEITKSKPTESRVANARSVRSNSNGQGGSSQLFITPTVSILPTSLGMSSFDAQSSSFPTVHSSNLIPPFPIELRDLSAAGLPGGVLPLSVELGDGFGDGIDNTVDVKGNGQYNSNIQDMAEGVQMGIKVRGLDLMRYGRLDHGLYKCTECEKIQIMKTFKTSYSFQRHAYLYHEGSPKRFPCPSCGKEFSRPDKRKSHLKEKHGLFNADVISDSTD